MENMDVNHIPSPPHYHQSTGLAEKYVQLVKSSLSKAKETGENPHFTLKLYRNTPPGNGLQLLIGLFCARKARSDLQISHATRMQIGHASTRPQA